MCKKTCGLLYRMGESVTFGERVKERREALGLSRHGLGLRVGLSGSYVGMLERGKIKSPTVEAAARLALALGTTVEWLQTGEGQAADVVLPAELEEIVELGQVNLLPEPQRSQERRKILAKWEELVAQGRIVPRLPDDDPVTPTRLVG